MTKRQPPNPGGLNRAGNGRGLAKVTRPVTKKRGTNATPEATAERALVARRGLDTSTNAGAALVDPDKPLTDKQKLFVKFWAQGESITSASHRAGYGDGAAYAYRMVKMPNVLKLYQEEKDAYEASVGMTRKRVMEGLLEGVEMAKLMAEPASMISGWREIGKMCGYYEPVKVKLEGGLGNALARLEQLSDEELYRLVTTPQIAGAPAND